MEFRTAFPILKQARTIRTNHTTGIGAGQRQTCAGRSLVRLSGAALRAYNPESRTHPRGRTVSIGVLLGGCGHYDGTDVHELVFTLLAVEAAGERAVPLPPRTPPEGTGARPSGGGGEAPRNRGRAGAPPARRPAPPPAGGAAGPTQ